nr:MAG TPA: hypothetical protein [Herelleviridae sp.]
MPTLRRDSSMHVISVRAWHKTGTVQCGRNAALPV